LFDSPAGPTELFFLYAGLILGSRGTRKIEIGGIVSVIEFNFDNKLEGNTQIVIDRELDTMCIQRITEQ